MRRNRVYFILLIMILVIIITFTSLGMLDVRKEEKYYQVSVIVSNSGSGRWISFKEGLEQGAKDNNINLNIVSTSAFDRLEEQNEIISREIKNGANGIVLEPSFKTSVDQTLETLLSGAALVLVETDFISENIYTTIKLDDYAIGKTTATEIKEDWHDEVNGIQIGVLSGNQNKPSLQQRLKGFSETIDQSGAHIRWNIEGSGDGVMQILQEKQKNEPVDVLVALDNDEIELTMDYMEYDKGSKFKVYGVGCSEKAVYYLDKGYIQALNVPNQFNMGYQSMVVIADQMNNHVITEKNINIDYIVVNKNNLYDKINEKLLFPIVQ